MDHFDPKLEYDIPKSSSYFHYHCGALLFNLRVISPTAFLLLFFSYLTSCYEFPFTKLFQTNLNYSKLTTHQPLATSTHVFRGCSSCQTTAHKCFDLSSINVLKIK